ncbi:MAG: intracellular septation protein [Planctomycetota bacterium]|jgi:intracellular septation protein
MTDQPPTDETQDLAVAAPEAGKALLKMGLELGPLAIFFVMNSKYGILEGTKAFMIALAICFPISWRLDGKMPFMALVTGVVVGVFGGLTIWLEDSTFIKLKPTVVSLLFATVMLAGLARGKFALKKLLGVSMQLDDEGWRLLTLRWSGFFIFVAIVNEIVWRSTTYDDDIWVKFKVFGILPMTFIFTLAQLGLMKRHELPEAGAASSVASSGKDKN